MKQYFLMSFGCLLNAFYMYNWLGPKGGEGPYGGLGNAMAMLAITTICLVISAIVITYMIVKKCSIKDNRMLFVNGVIMVLPVVITALCILYNITKNGF